MDKNIIIKELEDGFFLLRPKKGYKLFSRGLQWGISEAEVREESIKDFRAIRNA